MRNLSASILNDSIVFKPPFIKTLPNRNTDIERLFKKENIKPNIKFTTVDNYSTYAMVSAGL